MTFQPPHAADTRSDEALVAAINAGDAAAFDVLYHRYRDWVVGLAMRFTGNRDDALDVLQETFAYLLKKFPGFELSARMTTFLYPAVRNLSATARKKRLRLADDDAGNPVSPAVLQSAESSRAELAAVMQELSEEHREAILMRFVDDMTLEEIAAALGIPTAR